MILNFEYLLQKEETPPYKIKKEKKSHCDENSLEK